MAEENEAQGALDMLAPEITPEQDAVMRGDAPAPETQAEPPVGAGEQPAGEPEQPSSPAGEPAGDQPPPPDGYVPHAALHETREDLRSTRDELTQARERMARMEALFEQMQHGAGPGAEIEHEPQFQIPSYDEDPEGFYQGSLAALQHQVQALTHQLQTGQQQQQQQTQWDTTMSQYRAAANAFSQQQNDFSDAYKWLTETLSQDIQTRGYSDPNQIAQILQYEELGIVGRAMEAGKNPAQAVYEYARFRGYSPAEAQGVADAIEGATPDGTPPKVARDPATGKFTKLEQIERGQEAATSLSGGGAVEDGAMTLERLSELANEDPEAFDREWENMRRRGALG